ncbi:MAG: sugar ABC transporter substrate-binding protein [Trueperaceae bacterium]
MNKHAVRLFALMLIAMAGAVAAQTNLRVVIPYYSAATEPFFQEAASAFEAENPDITIELEVVNWDTLFQKLTTDIAGGAAPDVSIIGTRWLTDFVSQGIAEPLGDYMVEDDMGDRFIDVFLGPSEIEGEVYGLPWTASARAMFYNQEIFDEAGAEVPGTWSELRDAAAAISENTDVFGFGLQGKEIETDVYWYYAMWSFGGDIIAADGTSGIDSPEAIEAAEFYKGLIDDGLTQPEPTAYNRENLQDLFKQGRLAMVITAPFLIGQLADEAPDLEYGIAPVPQAEEQVTYGVTDSIMMFESSQNKDEAWRFLEFIFRPEVHIDFTVEESFLPVLTAETQTEFFQENERLRVFADLLPVARFAPNVADWERIADYTSAALQRIYLGEESAEAALSQAAGQIDRLLR